MQKGKRQNVDWRNVIEAIKNDDNYEILRPWVDGRDEDDFEKVRQPIEAHLRAVRAWKEFLKIRREEGAGADELAGQPPGDAAAWGW